MRRHPVTAPTGDDQPNCPALYPRRAPRRASGGITRRWSRRGGARREAHLDHLAVGVEHHGALQPALDALRDAELRDAAVARPSAAASVRKPASAGSGGVAMQREYATTLPRLRYAWRVPAGTTAVSPASRADPSAAGEELHAPLHDGEALLHPRVHVRRDAAARVDPHLAQHRRVAVLVGRVLEAEPVSEDRVVDDLRICADAHGGRLSVAAMRNLVCVRNST